MVYYKSRKKNYSRKKYEEVCESPEKKEEKEMGYKYYNDCDCHDKYDKCDKCDKYDKYDKCDKCDKCDDKCKCKEEENRFIEFDVDESTRIFFPGINGNGDDNGNGNGNRINSLAQVKVDVDCEDNEVLLQGTVEWTPNDLALTTLIVTALTTAGIVAPLSLEGTFRIFRSCKDGSSPVPIFETTDTSTINGLDLGSLLVPAALTLPLSTITTGFHYVDQNPCCGDNRYFLTLNLNLPNDPSITVGGVTGLLSSFLPALTFTSETKVFTATEIEEVDKKHKKY
ncbi:hypothetical protein [Virgibacillus necropolis]|uniref:Uncharacterized protein n=1 Tax=Virgibacillus necropolis TaxID=163877 RepID=A0A221MH30_9BACI|nr:hypothetical protein [Virgibacillus necropolis]ASN06957.1 hypothetical protein CFK40_19035 [Virgibacillus necropolis]